MNCRPVATSFTEIGAAHVVALDVGHARCDARGDDDRIETFVREFHGAGVRVQAQIHPVLG